MTENRRKARAIAIAKTEDKTASVIVIATASLLAIFAVLALAAFSVL